MTGLRHEPVILGVTGGMGTGKSTLCHFLARRQGWPLLDADRFGHDALRADSEIAQRVIERFGSSIVGPEGDIDRALLGRIVFADRNALMDLNAMTHPWILSRIETAEAALQGTGHADIILLEAALLPDWLDQIRRRRVVWPVVVVSPLLVRLGRLAEKGLARAEALRRIRMQVSLGPVPPRPCWVVENGGTLAELEAQGAELASRARTALRFWLAERPESDPGE
jgi:dephospho-CoA kinase